MKYLETRVKTYERFCYKLLTQKTFLTFVTTDSCQG